MIIGITGATGTLGKKLTGKLIDRDDHVIALCRNRDYAKKQLGYLPDIVEGDITRMETLNSFVKNLDVCIHLAAQVDHADKKCYWDVNVNGTKNLCDAIMQRNPKCRLVYCSSIAVLRLNKIKTNYSISKAKGEEIVRSMMTMGLSAAIIYSGLIFGAGDNRFIPHLVKGLKAGNIPLVRGGESWAPVIYIDDLCELFIKAVESDYAIGKSFLGIQQTCAGIHEFIKIIAKQYGCKIPDKKVSRAWLLLVARAMERFYSIPFIKKKPPINKRIIDILTINYRPFSFESEMRLGWQPKTSMEEGVKAFFKKDV